MLQLSLLSHAEKVFLAGCIKTTMLADGFIEESELEDLDSIYRKLDFKEYEKDLDEFEESVPDESSFFAAAEKITNKAAQDLILHTVYDLTLQNGSPADSQENIFMKLNRIWKK